MYVYNLICFVSVLVLRSSLESLQCSRLCHHLMRQQVGSLKNTENKKL